MNIDEFNALEDKGKNIEDYINDEYEAEVTGEEPSVEEPSEEQPTVETETPKEETPPVEELPKEPDSSTPKEDKPVQTPEENAIFAEQRRQKQLEERLEQERKKWEQERPEIKLAQQLSQMYGMPVDQILNQLQQANLQREAETKQVPVEVLQERQKLEQERQTMQDELNRIRAEQWATRMQYEEATLRTKYPNLKPEDFIAAANFMVSDLKNPDLPLEQAVRALHADKIFEWQKETLRQELLAEQSGRKPSPLPPQGTGKVEAESPTLTDDEKAVALAMGISEEDYLKYK